MTLSREEYEEFSKAAEPLMAWLRATQNPHAVAIVASDSAEVFEGVARHAAPVSATPEK